ncbi:helix-turn-helix domain-containing protein [Ruminococcus sp.]|uniref:helix-turn-helix domain-containing protein n=1 Tax=Ruminococcus sp. TaxID=41978 RepID=UPI0038647F02
MFITNLHIIGNKLLNFRKQKGLTQAEVAELADISDRSYADIERGSTNMRTETLVNICKALNITPNELLVEEEKRTINFDENEIIQRLNKCNSKEKATAFELLSVYLNSLD